MSTLKDDLARVVTIDGIKEIVEQIKESLAHSTPDEVNKSIGVTFALASIVVSAAGKDIRGVAGAFFLGVCGDDMSEALTILLENKRNADARNAASGKVHP